MSGSVADVEKPSDASHRWRRTRAMASTKVADTTNHNVITAHRYREAKLVVYRTVGGSQLARLVSRCPTAIGAGEYVSRSRRVIITLVQ